MDIYAEKFHIICPVSAFLKITSNGVQQEYLVDVWSASLHNPSPDFIRANVKFHLSVKYLTATNKNKRK